MKKVFMTGYSGGVGQIVSHSLKHMGIKVVGFSRNIKETEGVTEYISGTVTDYDLLKSSMEGCDAILHLAAYHMPYDAREQEVFEANVGGTFNVFKACAELRIQRLAVASSPNAVGYNFATKGFDLAYVPIDGMTPLFTTDIYSYSKECIESVGSYFYRRYGISSVFLRLGLDFRSTVEEWVKTERIRSDLSWLRKTVDELLSLPEKEAFAEVRRMENGIDAKRREAMTCGVPFKNGTEYVYDKFTEEQRIWNYYIHNFLMYLDSRDLAEGTIESLSSDFEGAHNIFIADHKNLLGIESAKIAALLYPGAKADYPRLEGYDAFVDYRQTERLIGWRAKHSVSDFYDELYSQQ